MMSADTLARCLAPARLAVLGRYDILDTPREPEFDDIVGVAAHVCRAPMALISLVDDRRQWFKAEIGLGARETPLEMAFCAHAIAERGLFVVGDAAADPRFARNPLVTGAPHLRFYAGAPLVTDEGEALGTLCVLDTVPRTLDEAQSRALAALARQVMQLLELRRALRRTTRHRRRIEAQQRELRQLNEELAAAVTRADGASRMKSEFLANMSHEIRTPLNAIIGFSELMKGAIFGPLDARYRGYADDVHRSGRHLLSIVNDILDLSRVEAGREILDEETIDPGALVAEAADLVRPQAAAKRLDLDVALSRDLPFLRGDRRRLTQVLGNLLSNAVKFTPEKGRIAIRAAQDAEGLLLTISDNGAGMTKDELAVAFEFYGQASSTSRRDVEGTGLGLPLARRLAELHGGALDLTSEPGKGTSARLRLPGTRLVAAPPREARRGG